MEREAEGLMEREAEGLTDGLRDADGSVISK
jgi:hypothetical protein